MFQAYLDWSAYIRQWENWLQWLIILGVFLCTVRLISIGYMTMGIYNSKLELSEGETKLLCNIESFVNGVSLFNQVNLQVNFLLFDAFQVLRNSLKISYSFIKSCCALKA